MGIISDFKAFIFRGDVIALSTGVIIGGAFGNIVKAFTTGIVNPLLQLFGAGEEVALGFDIKEGVRIDLGVIISALISFLITAAVIFFFIIKPASAFLAKTKKQEEAAPETPVAPAADIVLLTEIRDALKNR